MLFPKLELLKSTLAGSRLSSDQPMIQKQFLLRNRIKIDSVPRAMPDIHYLNRILNPLKQRVKRDGSWVERGNNLDLCCSVFGPLYFGAWKCSQNTSHSHPTVRAQVSFTARTDSTRVPVWASESLEGQLRPPKWQQRAFHDLVW